MIKLDRVSRIVPSGDRSLTILHEISLDIPQGQFVAIVGPSGSGKSTLLGLMAGLDRPTSGEVTVAGQNLTRLDEDAVARIRGQSIGIIFQSFHLIPTLTALENVQVPLELADQPDASARAHELLVRVGLGDRTHHHPGQLSGGEQQRVAIARAFSTGGQLLLADEPTGSLDSATGEQVMELLATLNRERHATMVLVTHNLELAARADRILTLKDGRVVADVLRT